MPIGVYFEIPEDSKLDRSHAIGDLVSKLDQAQRAIIKDHFQAQGIKVKRLYWDGNIMGANTDNPKGYDWLND